MDLLVMLFMVMAVAAITPGATAVEFIAINNATSTPGGARFTKEIGLSYSRQVLSDASSFIWETFNQQSPSQRKSVDRITFIVDNYDGVAYTLGDEIHLSAGYVAGYSGDVRTEVEGVMYHETTHVWQWAGSSSTPGGLIEGVADYVRLKAGLAPSHWVKPGEGDSWDHGYDVTARFLDYLTTYKSASFVADLNSKMETGYSDDFFVQLLGKTVAELWTEYKAYYGH